MKKLFKKLFVWISRLWSSLDNTVDQYIEIAIDITEAVKKIIESPVDDIIFEILKKAIPGTADDVLISKVKHHLETSLPIILIRLRLIQDISEIEDPNQQLQKILSEITFFDEESKAAFFHTLATMLIKDLSDGEISWTEAVHLSEFIYNKKYKR